ncbi:MAG TPA: hypothetical protein PK984_04520 [Paludibacteraceae bacterium]|nr:hypothetical protein [Paludibacteraceae bacterium]HOS37461.1 hypothetical protein [Paludibacteraceae bacterium]HPK20333.1 hypothetical protein [Paludibacteraceae bacterium]
MKKNFDVNQAVDEIIEAISLDNSVEVVAMKEILKTSTVCFLAILKSKDKNLYNVIEYLIKVYGTQIPQAIQDRKINIEKAELKKTLNLNY